MITGYSSLITDSLRDIHGRDLKTTRAEMTNSYSFGLHTRPGKCMIKKLVVMALGRAEGDVRILCTTDA